MSPDPSPREKPLILVVDDTEDNRVVLTAVLSHAGYPTMTAASGEEAIAKVREHRPTLVVLDYRMPGLGGGDVARVLAADPETADIMLIAVTADLSYTPAEARRDGFCAYLTQPVLPAHVRRAVDFCLADGKSSDARWIDLPEFYKMNPDD